MYSIFITTLFLCISTCKSWIVPVIFAVVTNCKKKRERHLLKTALKELLYTLSGRNGSYQGEYHHKIVLRLLRISFFFGLNLIFVIEIVFFYVYTFFVCFTRWFVLLINKSNTIHWNNNSNNKQKVTTKSIDVFFSVILFVNKFFFEWYYKTRLCVYS